MPLFGRSRPTARIGNPARRTSRNKIEASGASLTASGTRIRPRDADQMRRLVQPWQQRSYGYYDALGEIKYASQFYARMLSPLKLLAMEVDEKNDLKETTNAQAIAALDRIQDPGGGRTGLLGTYGRLMFLAGECYLLVSQDEDTGLEQWEMLSTDELRVQSGVYMRYRAPSLGAQEYRESEDPSDEESAWVPIDDKHAVAYRLWQRHPRFSMLADSTMQGVLDLCEELMLLTQAVRARARSRLAGSGILLIDDSITVDAQEAEPDEDPESDPVLQALIEAMTAPISDEGNASQVVPLLVRASTPEGMKIADLMSHLQLVDPTQLYPETGLRYECIKRMAIGLDMPPEILLGLQDSNHWTAWQIDEQTWKGHGQPKAQQLCDDLTSSYFRPYLRDVDGLADWSRFSVGYDATAIINHPDRSKDAKDLYAARAIGKKALREANGFEDNDAPTRDELAEMVGVATRDSSLAWFGTPAPRGGAVEVSPGEISADVPGAPSDTPAGADDSGAGSEKGPASGGNDTAPPVVGSAAFNQRVARILGGADLGLLRAREVAGARLVSLAKRDPALKDMLVGIPTSQVPAVLGRDRVRQLKVSEPDLVAGARALVLDALRMFGTDDRTAEVVAETVAQYAARTLYEKTPTSLPEAFAATVAELLVSANGNGNGHGP